MLHPNAFRQHTLIYAIIIALAFIVLVMLTLLIIGVFLKKEYSLDAQA